MPQLNSNILRLELPIIIVCEHIREWRWRSPQLLKIFTHELMNE